MFEAQDSVVVAQEQLGQKSSVLLRGEVISIEGQHATVAFEDEAVPRTVPVDSLRSAESIFGDTSGPGEQPIIDAIRR